MKRDRVRIRYDSIPKPRNPPQLDFVEDKRHNQGCIFMLCKPGQVITADLDDFIPKVEWQ